MKNFINKLSKINIKNKFSKKFQLLLAMLLFVVMLIIVFSPQKNGVKTKAEDVSKNQTNATDFITQTEKRLEKILSSIKGAGDVKVFVMANESTRFIYVSDNESEESVNGQTNTKTTSSVLVFTKEGSTTEPILELEIYPEITGVLVVAEGANDEKKRLMILNAVSVALDIENSKIEVLAGEKTK